MAGIKVIRPSERYKGAVQSTNMAREAGVSEETAGATTIWSGFVTTPPGATSGVHHHGDCESAIYVISGRVRFSWGDKLQYAQECGPGDFLFVPRKTEHRLRNTSTAQAEVLILASKGAL